MSTSKRAAKRAAQNRWDAEQRTILCLLYVAQFSPKERLRIFNHIFSAHLSSCGFNDGLKANTLSMQMRESKLARSTKHWREPLAITNSSEREIERETFQARIDDAVKALSGLQITTPQEPQTWVETNNVASSYFLDSLSPHISSTQPRSSLRPSSRRFTNTRCETPPPRLKTGSPTDRVLETVTVEIRTPRLASDTTAHTHSTAPSTPTRRQRRKKKAAEKIAYRQRTGGVMNISPKSYERIQNAKIIPVTEERAHPPLAGLLFRYFNEKSSGQNSKDGFIAGRFVNINGPRSRPPLCKNVDSADIENHMNRNSIASPFISTTDNLIWLLRLAMKGEAKGALEESTKGPINGSIALIDAHKLNKNAVYWAKPFHDQLKDHFVWTKGAWCYRGTHEFLVWDQIPRTAIIKIVTVSSLLQSTANHPVSHRIFALETLAQKAALKETVMTQLTESDVSLVKAIDSIAALAAFFGLNVQSPYKQIEHFVHEVVLGWCLRLIPQTFKQWDEHAASFVGSLCRYTRMFEPRLERTEKMKVAFLYGARNALARDWNVLFSSDSERKRKSHLSKIHKRAQEVNLQDPPAIVRLAFQAAVQKTLESINVYGAAQDHSYGFPLSKAPDGLSALTKSRFDQFRFDEGVQGIGEAQTHSRKQPALGSAIGAIDVREVIEVEDDDEERSSDFEMLDLSDRE